MLFVQVWSQPPFAVAHSSMSAHVGGPPMLLVQVKNVALPQPPLLVAHSSMSTQVMPSPE